MVDYGTVYNEIDSFLQTREGLANPKKQQDYVWFVRELTGIFCGAAFEHELDTKDIVEFLDLVRFHTIDDINTSGELVDVADLISTSVLMHPLYEITEFTLMNYKPGKVQVGPGEFFFCFYDSNSTFGIDNQAGYDVITDNVTTEFKTLGSNFTDPELLDGYANSPYVDRLLVVKPVSNAKKPLLRSRYACVRTEKWREAFTHTGKNGSLVLVA
jgi:hypothetical protein